MTLDQQLVQEIVGRVLQRLSTPPAAVRDASVSVGEPTSDVVGSDNGSAKALVIEDKVVTEDLLAARVNGHRQISVAKGSVITPSGRDFLRKSGVEWSWASTSSAQPNSKAKWKAIVLKSTDALDKLLEDLSGWKSESASCERGSVQQIAESNDVAGTCLFTASPERAACRSNRHSHLRAAAVTDVASVRRVQADVGANVFCVSAEGRSYFELRNMLRAISAVTPVEPKEWT